MEFNECNKCTICCQGYLYGTAYGHQFGNLNKCYFLQDNTCSIYPIRPHTCSKYFCAWKQKLFPDFMRPDLCNVIISIEKENNLKVIYVNEIAPLIKKEIENFVEKNKCGVTYVRL